MVRVKTDDRRRAIIDAATKVFRDVGYGRASMDGIAREAGGSKATLYGYFKSKDELFEAAMESAVEVAAEKILNILYAELENLQAALERLAGAYLEFVLGKDILPITRAIVGEGPARGLGPRLFDKGPRRGLKLMAQFFEEQMGQGRLRAADPITVALHFKGLVESDHLEAALYGARATHERKAAIADAVTAFLAAYQPEGQ